MWLRAPVHGCARFARARAHFARACAHFAPVCAWLCAPCTCPCALCTCLRMTLHAVRVTALLSLPFAACSLARSLRCLSLLAPWHAAFAAFHCLALLSHRVMSRPCTHICSFPLAEMHKNAAVHTHSCTRMCIVGAHTHMHTHIHTPQLWLCTRAMHTHTCSCTHAHAHMNNNLKIRKN